MTYYDLKKSAATDGAEEAAYLFGATSATASRPARFPIESIRKGISAWDYIPYSLHASIADYTCTTDLATYLNNFINAIDSNGGCGHMPAGLYPIASGIGTSNLRNLTLTGEGGRDLQYMGNSGTVIKYTGTGTGRIFDLREHHGVFIEDIQVMYVSDAFEGTVFDLSCALAIGNGSGFKRVQVYQISGIGNNCDRIAYFKNTVDIYFDECYFSHAQRGLVGVEDDDLSTDETNVVSIHKCTFIALKGPAIVNPVIGWSIYATNFELGVAGIASGIKVTASKACTNLGLFGCIFADASVSGTWIDIQDVYNFTMSGGAIIGLDPGDPVNAIKIGGTYNSGICISGVRFSSIETAIEFAAACVGVTVIGCSFLGVTTKVTGTENLTAEYLFTANNPALGLAIPVAQGGTGVTTATGTGAVMRQVGPTIEATTGGDIAALKITTSGPGENAGITYQDDNASKWTIYKNIFHELIFYDLANNVLALSATPSDAIYAHWDIAYTTPATSSATGALRVLGGLGIAGAIYSGNEITPGLTTVASLPAASSALRGARYTCSDLSGATFTFGANATGGGSRVGPVWCNGSTWKEG